jgi:glycosyltransferase involved in cell wall biosynthesis
MTFPLPSTAPAAAASLAPGGESPISAAHLGARAQELLAGGDIDAYRLLFAHATRLEDPSRRYHARVVLLECGLAAAVSASSVPAAPVLMAVADTAVEVLEAQPSEPVVLNCAAVALRELGNVDAALALFQAAQRLDPSLPGLEQNLAAVRSRHRGRPGARSVQAALSSVSRRATVAAQQARPAAGLTLSLCMIVRDEEEMLPRCLEAIAPVVDEIVVVDTGSRDATIEIARSFGARVIEHKWTDSFAEARNISFDAATGDWLMFLDADQVLVSEDAERLRALTGHTWREAFYLVETSSLGETGDGFAATDNVLRVFRNRPQYRFEGRVHEQITHNLPVYAPGRIQQTTVRIRHYGYLEAVRSSKAKSQRNIDLLRKQANESPPDAFLHFNLGSEYAADGDTAAALTEFERAWSMIVAQGSGVDYRYAPPLVARLVEAMRQSGRLDDAASLAAEGLRRYPEFTDLVFAQARIAFETGAFDDAREHYRRCIALGDAPARYRPIVGSGTYLPRIALAQLALNDGDDEVARRLLAWCLERYPTFHGVVAPYLSLLLRAGVPAEAAVAEVEGRVESLTPTVRFMLGSALQDAGALPAAERQYRSVVADQPDNAQARVALAETLLRLGDNTGAASQAALVSKDDTCAAVAFQIELCALISGGNLGAASDAFAQRRVALSEIGREVFGTWLAIASGLPSPRSLPVAAATLLKAILETLLSARSFQQFEVLLPALENSDLPARQRRELLGEIYLRRGFLASAAKEWMAVCADRPDAAALLGLARVAVANDQPQDAAVFASGALELEPENIAAAEILARVENGQPSADRPEISTSAGGGG